MKKPPKVFISHASEDKERFVEDFAKKLKESGVDVWYDTWAMLPGDNLFDKIFSDGIGKADVFVVVLSKNSINKPWVQEELDAGHIRKIEGNFKIIPIVLDECDVPLALRSLLYEKIEDLQEYSEEFNRIVDGIFERRAEPVHGAPPEYTKKHLPQINGFTQTDMYVLICICEISIEQGYSQINTKEVVSRLAPLGINDSQVEDSLNILAEEYYINPAKDIRDKIDYFEITVKGFGQYLENFLDNYELILRQVLGACVNQEKTKKKDIAEYTGIQEGMVYQLLRLLNAIGFIVLQEYIGGQVRVSEVKMKGRRFLGEG